MSWLVPLVTAGALGVALSMQPAINGASATVLHSVFAAALLSLTVSALSVVVVYILSGAPVEPAQILRLPWWSLLAGLIGAAFVTGAAVLVPVLGATTFFLCLIAGQLIGSVAIDAIGAFGLEARPPSASRLAGVLLAMAGVWLVQRG